MRRWLIGWIPLWLYTNIIFERAVIPVEAIPTWLARWNDKLLHGAQYFLLFYVALNAFVRSRSKWVKTRSQMNAYLYCLVIGAATEIVQLYVPSRQGDFFDWVADGIGAAIALVIGLKIIRRTRLI